MIIKELSKSFGKKQVLKKISFSIGAAEIVGLIGPNGSGKTTLLNILLSITTPSSGSFSREPSETVGMSVSRKGFFADLSVKDNLELISLVAKGDKETLKRIFELFSIDFSDTKFSKLSAGMKQRVSLVLAFIKDYKLILLDEPTNHLDIDSILALRNLILERKKSGTSFLITSHILSDLEKVCDRVLFLKNGEITESHQVKELVDRFGDLEMAYSTISLK
jgi:ABC-2 type transport system ATP-binding protein